MKSVSNPKNGRVAVNGVEALGFGLRQVLQPHAHDAETGSARCGTEWRRRARP